MKRHPYSYDAIREVYDLENRKGNINIDMLPETYRDLLAEIKDKRSELNELRHQNVRTLDKDAKDAYYNLVLEKRRKIRELLKQKDSQLEEFLRQISQIIGSRSYNFTIERDNVYSNANAEFFHVKKNGLEDVLMSKLLCQELSAMFKVKTGDRHQIMSTIKGLLNPKKSHLYVIRTDVQNFFENINQQALLNIIKSNPHISRKCVGCIESVLSQFEHLKSGATSSQAFGIPRGIGISSILAELYLRELDLYIKKRQNILFYSRYVDDIFIILTHLNHGQTLNDFLNDISSSEYLNGLSLHPLHSGKSEIIEYPCSSTSLSDVTYLGYKIRFDSNSKGITFSLSDKRVDKLKQRIDNAFDYFERNYQRNPRTARKTLLDCLNLISANLCLHKTKHGIKVGISYNNDLMNPDRSQLDNVMWYMRGKVRNLTLDSKPFGSEHLKDEFLNRLKNKIDQINFYDRWDNKVFFSFGIDRMSILSRIIGR